MAAYEQSVGASNEWYTPQYIFTALGCRFDMDVASPGVDVVPWVPSNTHIVASSLEKKWCGFIWMNPPFGGRNGIVPWLEKFIAHADGIALFPDRTSAPWWRRFAPQFELLCFVPPKIHFIPGPGVKESSPGQGTCLGALGAQGVAALEQCNLGALFEPSR